MIVPNYQDFSEYFNDIDVYQADHDNNGLRNNLLGYMPDNLSGLTFVRRSQWASTFTDAASRIFQFLRPETGNSLGVADRLLEFDIINCMVCCDETDLWTYPEVLEAFAKSELVINPAIAS